LFFFSLANFGLPLSFNFIGELLIILGTIQQNFSLLILIITGVFFSLVYSLWLFNRIIFGNVKLNYIKNSIDLYRYEVYLLLPLFFLTTILGIYPISFFSSLDTTIKFSTLLLVV